MRTLSKKQKIGATIAAAGVLAVAGGGIAFAYWTTTGSGDSSATAGTTSGTLTINGPATAPTGLYPGMAAAALSGTFTNTNLSKVYVQQVTITIENSNLTAWSAQADNSKPACTASDFTIVQPTATNAEVNTGSTSTWAGASIAMIDNGSANQDNCKNVTVPLHYSSN